MANKIQLRRDTASNWTSTNPTLSQGEQGYETDTSKFKIGDGTTAWTSLAYFTGYTDANVNSHLNTSTATSGEVLSWTGTDYDWVAQSGGGGAPLYAAETTGSTDPTATGTLGLAIGSGATASGGSSVAVGKSSIAAGSEAVALGIARAGNASSLAIQIGTNSSSYGAFGNNGHAVGMLTQVNGLGFAFGRTAISSGGGGALALGMDTTSSGSGAITLGRAVTSSHTDAVVIGSGASSSANDQITLGHTDQTVRISSSYVLPSVDGTAGQVLTTDGNGNVSWVTP
jgi:hypothetical protein